MISTMVWVIVTSGLLCHLNPKSKEICGLVWHLPTLLNLVDLDANQLYIVVFHLYISFFAQTP